jgi:hypothetical protein
MALPKVIIQRYDWNHNATYGICYVKPSWGTRTEFKAESLERAWKNNKKEVSCVPPGVYPLVREYSPKFDQFLWELKEVHNRSECKFHAANFWDELNGCIALGESRYDLNKDGTLDITSSRDTIAEFHEALRHYDYAQLIIEYV